MGILRKLFCTHNFQFVRNFYGDEIIKQGWNRSLWRCSKCGSTVRMDGLGAELADLSARTHAACDQLTRYGDAVATEALADVLDAITDLNDDLCNWRHEKCIQARIDTVQALLEAMRP